MPIAYVNVMGKTMNTTISIDAPQNEDSDPSILRNANVLEFDENNNVTIIPVEW